MATVYPTTSEEALQGVLDGLPIALVLLAGVGAPLTSWYAARRARHPGAWFLLGAVTGPLALALLAVAPPGRCPACDTRVDGWIRACRRCGTPFRGGDIERRPMMAEDELIGDTPLDMPTTISSAPSRGPLGTSPTPIASARGATRRDVRIDWPGRPMVSPMALGTRPSFTPSNYSAATAKDDEASAEMLSTGVYISGNAGLEIGACYGIARRGSRLRVIGPVDAGQLTVRYDGAVNDFDVTAMDDRVIISGREGRSSLAIVFRTIGGMRAADLELALAGPTAGTRS